MIRFVIFSLITFLPLASLAEASEAVNEKNWMSHPRIKEVRKVYEETERAIASGKVKETHREFAYCEPYVDTDREIFVSPEGRVLKYVNSKGSEDSAVRQSFYYDGMGRLRFIFAKCGAANGTKLEVRIYLDEQGKRLWEDRKLVNGPGYTFPRPWPDKELIFHPKISFEAKNKCE